MESYTALLPVPHRWDEIVALTTVRFPTLASVLEQEAGGERYAVLVVRQALPVADVDAWRVAVAAHVPSNTPTREDVRRTVQARLASAVAANTTYLNTLETTATAAQVRTQVARLTREATGLMRLALEALDDTAGT